VLLIETGLRMTLGISVALAALALFAGCGGSSKPDYCSNVSDLEGSVDELVALTPQIKGTATTAKELSSPTQSACE